VRVGLFVLMAALVLAGCTTVVGSRPVGPDEVPLTSSVLGEPTTIDQCSLTGPGSLEQVGSAKAWAGLPPLA